MGTSALGRMLICILLLSSRHFSLLSSRLSVSAWRDFLRPVGGKRQSRALDSARDDRGRVSPCHVPLKKTRFYFVFCSLIRIFAAEMDLATFSDGY